MVTYKKIIILKNFAEGIKKMPNTSDYAPVILLNKLVKKTAPLIEEMNDEIDDLRIEHCHKDNNKITRDAQGNYEFTAEGERAFKKAHKQLMDKEVNIEFMPLSYSALCEVLPDDFADQNPWEMVADVLEPFYQHE